MPNYLEMVRLHEAGFSLRQIAKIVGSGRSTVTRTVNIAQEKGLGYEGFSQTRCHDAVIVGRICSNLSTKWTDLLSVDSV